MGYSLIDDPDLEARLKRCVEARHADNSDSEMVRQAFAQKNTAMMTDIRRMMMDQASALVCLCDLAGVTPEDVIRQWVELMESQHPRLKSAGH